jgi:hypothetical protein
MRRKSKKELKGFELLPKSSGIILNGIYLKEDRTEVIVQCAWGGNFHFKFQELKEKT